MTAEQTPNPYFDDIDLRPYIKALIRFWYLLIVLPLLAIVASYINQIYFVSPVYRAVALVTVTAQTLDVELDARIQDSNTPLAANRSFPELALSDSVIEKLFLDVGDDLPNFISSQFSLRSRLLAESGSDLSIVRLSAQFEDPELAALVANRWAKVFVDSINQTLGSEDQTALTGLEIKLQDAFENRIALENAFVEFRGRDTAVTLSVSFSSNQAILTTALARQREIQFAQQNIINLRHVIENSPSEALNENAISLFLIQLSAIQVDLDLAHVDIDASTFESELSKEIQLELLDTIEQVLVAEGVQIEEMILATEPILQDIQQEIARIDNERARVTEEMELAREIHQSIERQVEEFGVTSEISGQVRLVSQAAVPVSPQRSLTPVAVVGMAVFFLIFLVIIALVWWQEFNKMEQGK